LRIPLKGIADIDAGTGRYAVLHDGARRKQTVTCNVTGRDVGGFVAEARKAIEAKVKFPRGLYASYGGAAEEQAMAQSELLLHSGFAAVAIVILLSMVFGRWQNLLLVLANLPFALVGGVLAIYLQARLGGAGHGNLSLGALVGFVTLFGITTRNSIMLISHVDHLVNFEGAGWSIATVSRAASERLLPILMTALVTGLGLLPLALGSGEAGREIEGPMAVVILGGLVTSTILNLLLLPAIAWRYGNFSPSAAEEM
jgi:Cu/Ag efflux pump CusA